MGSQAHPVLPGLQAAAGVHTGLAVLAVEQLLTTGGAGVVLRALNC
jgi:hypothetical protein